jgi:hypothetical protein
MIARLKRSLACGLIFLASVAGAAADCRLVVGATDLTDGTWLFRTNGVWQPISELKAVVADGKSREVNFAYVAREPALKNLRRGILVIKTGSNGPGVDAVALAREAYTAVREASRNVDQCKSYPKMPDRSSVAGRSYDRYHDYSDDVEATDQTTLNSFHVGYPARTGGCRRSNDDATDSLFTGRWQSNISQFSFDRTVVETGQRSRFFAQFGATPAYASSMSRRHVEMKRYNADDTGLACVLFARKVEPGFFVRINDLERRDWLFRVPEQSWEWPR